MSTSTAPDRHSWPAGTPTSTRRMASGKWTAGSNVSSPSPRARIFSASSAWPRASVLRRAAGSVNSDDCPSYRVTLSSRCSLWETYTMQGYAGRQVTSLTYDAATAFISVDLPLLRGPKMRT